MRRDERLFQHLMIGVLLFILIATFFYHHVEKLDMVDSLYVSIVTISTVGYGDITPKTDLGKMFTSIYILFGVGLLLQTLSQFFKVRLTRHHEKQILELKSELIKQKEEIKEEKKKTRKTRSKKK